MSNVMLSTNPLYVAKSTPSLSTIEETLKNLFPALGEIIPSQGMLDEVTKQCAASPVLQLTEEGHKVWAAVKSYNAQTENAKAKLQKAADYLEMCKEDGAESEVKAAQRRVDKLTAESLVPTFVTLHKADNAYTLVPVVDETQDTERYSLENLTAECIKFASPALDLSKEDEEKYGRAFKYVKASAVRCVVAKLTGKYPEDVKA
jgi:hypothetical protein